MRHGVNGVALCLTILALSGFWTGCGSGSGTSSADSGDMAAAGPAGPYGDLLPNAEELWSDTVPVNSDVGSLESIHLLQTPDITGKLVATLYLISSKHKLIAIDVDGRPKWTFGRLELPPVFPPAEGPTAVAILTRDRLWIVDRETGSLLNRKTLSFTPSAPPVLSRSTIYIPSLSDNRIHTVAISDGSEGWRVRLGSPIAAAPAIAGTVGRPTLHVATQKGTVIAFDALAAAAPPPTQELWKRSLADGVVADLATSIDASIVYVSSEDFALHAFRASTGEKVWSYAAGRSLNTHATDVNGVVFQKNGGQLVAIDGETGDEKWSIDGGMRPVCRWGDHYLVAGPGQRVRRINAPDGAELAAGDVVEDFLLCDPVGGLFVVASRNWFLKVLKYRK
jgi:outer membrane protein assembly factor BamB